MLGPVSSGYPGKYVLICVVIFWVCLYAVGVRRFLRHRKTFSPNTATAGTKEPSLNGLVFFAMLLIFLIAMALWEIYRHRPY
jgi:hypothetical protein